MNPANLPADDETSRLLASRFKDTTPEFEARWVELKRTLRNAPPPRRRFFGSLPFWTSVFGAGVAVAAVVLVLRSPARSPAAPVALEELWAMNEVLSDGTALLDAGNRADLLFLSTEASPHANLP